MAYIQADDQASSDPIHSFKLVNNGFCQILILWEGFPRANLKKMLVCCLPIQNFQAGLGDRKKVFFTLCHRKGTYFKAKLFTLGLDGEYQKSLIIKILAHNGRRFDFPVLVSAFLKGRNVNQLLSSVCGFVDSLTVFRKKYPGRASSLVDELNIIGQKYTHRSTRQNWSQIKACYLYCQYSGVVGSEKCSIIL